MAGLMFRVFQRFRGVRMKPRIIILDDDQATLAALKQIFGEGGMDYIFKGDAESALCCIRQKRPNVALLDLRLSQVDGLKIIGEIKIIDPSLTVIMTTDLSNTRTAIEVMKNGAYDLLTKPFDKQVLKRTVEKAVECNLLNKKVRITRSYSNELDENLDEDIMIGSTPEMMEIWKMVGKVADSDAAVLITGDSGTGKELLARAIYSNSKRRNRLFLAVNCAAVPENLLESEFFGHEKGSFTDAHCRKIGKFEQCDGGTIFLDEIGEMSLANQGKLLRVLENQEFERVGGNETISVDVRIIAASNRCLHEEVMKNGFRLDLFSRLRVISFHLPPLRERTADIPLLVNLFIRKYSRKNGKPIKDISPQALQLLMNHSWQGNIRELQNAINSAVVLSNGPVLTHEDFVMLQDNEPVQNQLELTETGTNFCDMFRSILEPLFDVICRNNNGKVYENVNSGFEMALIRMALVKCKQNQVLASKMLGISRNTLRARIDRFNLHDK